MQLKILDITPDSFIPSLEKIIALDLDMNTAYDLAASINILADRKQNFVKVRQSLFNKYGEVQGDNHVIKQEHLEVFGKKMEELVNIEFEIPLKEPIKLPADVNFKAIDLLPILKLVVNV